VVVVEKKQLGDALVIGDVMSIETDLNSGKGK